MKYSIKRIVTIPLRAAGRVERGISLVLGKILRKIERLKIKMHWYRTLEISVDDMLLKQKRSGEFTRCDIIVRLLAVENYYGKNSTGFELYKKMQDARVGAGYGEESLKTFIRLIESYDKEGYKKSSGIISDRDFNLIDGSHRMALALYHDISNVTAHIVNSRHDVEYSIDWFFMNGFTTDETDTIAAKCKEVLERINNKFACVIWSPAGEYTDEIIEDLGIYGNVGEVRRYQLTPGEYENTVRAVYAIDDIEKWKIDRKLQHMSNYSPTLSYVDISFDDPDYRIKKKTGLLLSRRAERVKKALRAKYKDRIRDYYFDIILHIGDNVYQSNYMNRIFHQDLDFKEIVTVLNNYRYAFVKVDVPYMPQDFPDTVSVGKDADILCDENDIDAVLDGIRESLGKYTYYNILYIKEQYRLRIRIQQGNTLYYLIDIEYGDKDKNDFVEDALENRVYSDRGFYVLSPEFEYIVRAGEYYRNRKKDYHRQYLLEHSDDYDEGLFGRYCSFALKDVISQNTEKRR